jgi:hypothetical protein
MAIERTVRGGIGSEADGVAEHVPPADTHPMAANPPKAIRPSASEGPAAVIRRRCDTRLGSAALPDGAHDGRPAAIAPQVITVLPDITDQLAEGGDERASPMKPGHVYLDRRST